MKQHFWRLLWMLTGLLMVACNLSQPTGPAPDLVDGDYIDAFSYVLLIFPSETSGGFLRATLIVKGNEFDGILKIKGREMESWDVDEFDGYRCYNYDSIVGSAGDTVTYSLDTGMAIYSSSIRIPHHIELDLPGLDPYNDYLFSWTTAKNPWNYWLIYEIGTSYNDYWGEKQIDGTLRSYTIPEYTWSGEPAEVVEISLQAVNYKSHNSNLVVLGMNYDVESSSNADSSQKERLSGVELFSRNLKQLRLN